MGFLSSIFNSELIIGETNPCNGKPMNGVVAQINGKWKEEYADILIRKAVKHLFLSTALGWTCDNYNFLRSYWNLLYIVRNKSFYIQAPKRRKLHTFVQQI